MTSMRFNELVAIPGDTKTLRPELAAFPFWRTSKCSITMKYQDGLIFKEDCTQAAKTIDGRYLVLSMYSQFYKQTMYAIAAYDEKASAVRQWSLFGDTLTEATIIIDPETKVSASTSRYGDGFMEICAGSYTDIVMTDHAEVFKDGRLFMTRDAKTWPIPTAQKVEQDGPPNNPQRGSF